MAEGQDTTPLLRALARISGVGLDASLLAGGAVIADASLSLRQVFRHWGTGLSIGTSWIRAWEADPVVRSLRAGLVEDGQALSRVCAEQGWHLEVALWARFVAQTPAVGLQTDTLAWLADLGVDYDVDMNAFSELND